MCLPSCQNYMAGGSPQLAAKYNIFYKIDTSSAYSEVVNKFLLQIC